MNYWRSLNRGLVLLFFLGAISEDAHCAKTFGFGPAPTYEAVQKMVQSHLRAYLKDPDAVQGLAIAKPVAECFGRGVCGWKICVSYNAKNSYGAYVGYKTYVYWRLNNSKTQINENASACPVVTDNWDGTTPPVYAVFCDVQPEHPDCANGRTEEFAEFIPVGGYPASADVSSPCTDGMRKKMKDKGLSEGDITGVCGCAPEVVTELRSKGLPDLDIQEICNPK
jgi:hypothetical protein